MFPPPQFEQVKNSWKQDYKLSFLPRTNHHAGDPQQLKANFGNGAQRQVAVHAADRHVQRQAGKVLHRGHFHQPVHQNVPKEWHK